MATSGRLATRSRLPVGAVLGIVALVVAVVAVLVALYLARRSGAAASVAALDMILLQPSESTLATRTAASPPPAVRLAETVVGARAAGWALVPVPRDRLPRSVSLSRPAGGRASVWSVEPGEDADAPVLTVLLRPGEGEGNGPPTSDAMASGAASLGPLPSYHGAPHVLVVFHAREGEGERKLEGEGEPRGEPEGERELEGEGEPRGEPEDGPGLPAVLGVVAEKFDALA
jgi:hypothetical protein